MSYRIDIEIINLTRFINFFYFFYFHDFNSFYNFNDHNFKFNILSICFPIINNFIVFFLFLQYLFEKNLNRTYLNYLPTI